jgi:hypothetical protein
VLGLFHLSTAELDNTPAVISPVGGLQVVQELTVTFTSEEAFVQPDELVTVTLYVPAVLTEID